MFHVWVALYQATDDNLATIGDRASPIMRINNIHGGFLCANS